MGDEQEKKNRKEQARIEGLIKQLADEIDQVKDEVMEYTKKKKLKIEDFKGIKLMKESLNDIIEEYKNEDIEEKIDDKKVKKLYELIDLMLSAEPKKKSVVDQKVDKKPDENVQGKASQSAMQRKGRKPSVSKPVASSTAPKKASALPQRKTRGRPAKKEEEFVKVEKPKFTIDKSKQPKTTPSKIDIKIKPSLNTKKIVPKKKEEKVDDKAVYPDLFKDVDKEDEPLPDDIFKYPLADKLTLLDTFVEKYKNNVNTAGQDIFENRPQAQKFFRKTFEAIRKISIDANRNNLGFQGVSMAIQKPANRLLNKVARLSDEEDVKTGITLLTDKQPIRHFIRYISDGAKDIKKQRKSAGKKGILKGDMDKYKGYSAKDLQEILKRNNLSETGSRFDMVNRILNNDIKLPPKATKDKKEKGVKIKVAQKDTSDSDGFQTDTKNLEDFLKTHDFKNEKDSDRFDRNIKKDGAKYRIDKLSSTLELKTPQATFKFIMDKAPEPPADDTESEEEEETEEERKERERISENNMKNIDIMKNIVSALARTFNQRISLDQKEYELTDEQIQDVKSKILSKDPLEILDEYRKYNTQLKNMEDTFRGKRLKKSLKNLKFLIDDIVRANRKRYDETFVKKQEIRPVDKEGIPEFDIARFIQESMEEALDNAQNEQEIDDDENEEEITDINDERVQELIKRMKRGIQKLEPKVVKFTDKKELRTIHQELNKIVQDWKNEYNAYLDDDLDEIVIEKAKDKLRTLGRDVIKKRQKDKEYLESFRGVTGRATDPAGTEHTWRTQREYSEISNIVHQAILKKLNELKTTDHPEFQEWEKFRSKTLPAQLDKFYKEVDRRN